MNDEHIKTLIANMYEDRVPLNRLLGLNGEFKVPIKRLAVLLFKGNPATKEDSDRMEAEAIAYIDMMTSLEILTVIDKEKGIVSGGKNFEIFLREVTGYLDSDNIIIRTLGISRQDFDKIVNEYVKLTKGPTDIDSILACWSSLPQDVRLGIVRGVFLQRSIMGGILQDLKNRAGATINYTTQTIQTIDSILGVQSTNAPAEPTDNPAPK